jgi:type I restriction enzyme M protein
MMTLHEAIKSIIEKSNKPLKAREIASMINKYSLYSRKDEKAITQNQVLARIKKYKNIFQTTDDGSIELVSEETIQKEEFFRWVRNILVHSPEPDLDTVVLFLTYIMRVTSTPPIGYLLQFKFDWSSLVLADKPKELILDNHYYENSFDLPHEAVDEIKATFRKIDAQYLSGLIRGLNNFYDFICELSETDLRSFYAKLILQVSSRGIRSYEFGTPAIVSKFTSRLVSSRQYHKIYDPYAGFCTLLTEIVSTQNSASIYANDINKKVGTIGLLNLMLNAEGRIVFSFKDAIDTYTDEAFDLIVSSPPLATNDSKEEVWRRRAFNIPTTPVEYIYFHLSQKGKAFIIVADSFLYNSDRSNVEFRKKLLTENAIEAIISLPAGTFQPYSAFAASVIILEKGVSRSQVYFADFRSISNEEFELRLEEFTTNIRKRNDIEGISGTLDSQQILMDDTINLLPRKNILNQQALSFDLSQSIKLKDLIKRKIKGVAVPLSNLNEESDGIPYVRISDLSDITSLVSNPAKYISDPDQLDPNVKRIERGTILLARIGNSIKPSVYELDEPAVASPNLLCFTVDNTKIKPSYLAKELQAQYVKQQLQTIHIVGSGPNYYRERDLLELRIIVPSLQDQEERINYYNESLIYHLHNLQSKITRSHIEPPSDVKVEMTNTADNSSAKEEKPIKEKEIISSIKHRISQYVSPISSDLHNLQLYYERKSSESTPVSLEDKVSSRKTAITIKEVFTRVNANLQGISDTFNLMEKILDYNEKNRNIGEYNIADVILDAYNSVRDRMDGVKFSYSTEFPLESRDLLINIDYSQMKELLRNFFLNSVKHGFDETILKKVINVFVTKNTNENLLEINLMNNGKPFPDGFTLDDFTAFGTKGNASEGTGIGGYLMKKIVENHSGRLELISDHNLNFTIIDENNEVITSVPTIYFKVSLPYITE